MNPKNLIQRHFVGLALKGLINAVVKTNLINFSSMQHNFDV